ncbi:MMPL family transporter [Vibrio sp. SNU_ST1]|uniref:MMPL family transporter n=1 Tax=Vibrio sp. SNU_ST1 TaxID=3064001 RepID=UPI00272DA49D|nr:MMPL family transporter [Vibrio sp. SNU_ST1]WKY58733.1 MMPL family transporter [Vibrio sp. SNU_ST1]
MPKRNNSNSSLALAWLVVVVLFSGLLIKQFAFSSSVPIESNIMKLLPENQQDPMVEQAFQQISSSMSEQVVFILSGSDSKNTMAATKAFENSLNQRSFSGEPTLFKRVQGKINASTQSQWSDFYFRHRAQLLTEQQKDTLTHTPESRAQYVIQSLYNPFSGVTAAELSLDPFLLFRDYISAVSVQSSNFALKEGYLTAQSNEQSYTLVTATLAGSPYSLAIQEQLPALDTLEREIEKQFGVKVQHTGVVFYANYGTESAKSEISTIGLGSLAGVILLVWLTFRSALPLALSLLSISTGLLVALASTVAIFGKIHLFSLVFGTSLIGVSIDYSFHYLTDRLAAGSQWQSDKGLKHILVAITLGLITSLIGYLGLLVAPFPGLQQLALFSSIGLIAAYASVVCWYPVLAFKPSQQRELPLANLWHAWLNLWNKPKFKVGLPLGVIIVSLASISQVRYDDDIRQLQAMPDQLKQQEQAITKISGLGSGQNMLLVTAKSNQKLLTKLAEITTSLDSLVDSQGISGYRSINQHLLSKQEQHDNYQLVKQLYSQQSHILQSTLGWPTFPELPKFEAITVSGFLKSPVSEPVRPLWLKPIDGQAASVILIKDVTNSELFSQWLESSFAQQQDVKYLNKADEISTLFAEYRVKITELLLIALAAIGMVLGWRYGVKQSLLMLLPSLIAGVAGLAVTGILGSTLNLFNLLGLILILGIGIDYTLFFAEQKKSLSTLLAITLSGLTTLLSFGLLSLSQTHAIHSFGVTVLTGIFVAWLLSPLAINNEQATEKNKPREVFR